MAVLQTRPVTSLLFSYFYALLKGTLINKLIILRPQEDLVW